MVQIRSSYFPFLKTKGLPNLKLYSLTILSSLSSHRPPLSFLSGGGATTREPAGAGRLRSFFVGQQLDEAVRQRYRDSEAASACSSPSFLRRAAVADTSSNPQLQPTPTSSQAH
ncbi:hypothetical protein KY290_005130 [Solanum tuberosum]|uniref:Uncharacterized protein n=1 Tax=Solanum tuberosum TaxID=4113 RepID=A0ABQ7WD92_SOLTU|nr:hypothetical protein KY285_024818 [Solanum tuberosum]KAH0778703.1 hypothetical protein KY290_005130 [Solanum tuberosum]